jgi:Leucine-rich repeat (LRR) protein
LPKEILNLHALQSLSLKGNHITHLPIEMTKLTNLRKIDLRDQSIPLDSIDSPLSNEGRKVLNYFAQIVRL